MSLTDGPSLCLRFWSSALGAGPGRGSGGIARPRLGLCGLGGSGGRLRGAQRVFALACSGLCGPDRRRGPGPVHRLLPCSLFRYRPPLSLGNRGCSVCSVRDIRVLILGKGLGLTVARWGAAPCSLAGVKAVRGASSCKLCLPFTAVAVLKSFLQQLI